MRCMNFEDPITSMVSKSSLLRIFENQFAAGDTSRSAIKITDFRTSHGLFSGQIGGRDGEKCIKEAQF